MSVWKPPLIACLMASTMVAAHIRWKRDASGGVKTKSFEARRHFVVPCGATGCEAAQQDIAGRGLRPISVVAGSALLVSGPSWASVPNRWFIAPASKVSPAEEMSQGWYLAEFHPDVSPSTVLTILRGLGVWNQPHPDLLDHQFLLNATPDQIQQLSEWDELAYVFPASPELIKGAPVRGCHGPLTETGVMGQYISTFSEGWDGAGQGSAELTYSISNPVDRLPADVIELQVRKALEEWSRHVAVSFRELPSPVPLRHINVLFASGSHGDPFAFDGPGGVLAHTFYPVPVNPEPLAGDLHLDAEERWRQGDDMDLYSVLLHEAGHALGLGHSDVPGTVMYPYYKIVQSLTDEDVRAALNLYAPATAIAVVTAGLPDPPVPAGTSGSTPIPVPGTQGSGASPAPPPTPAGSTPPKAPASPTLPAPQPSSSSPLPTATPDVPVPGDTGASVPAPSTPVTPAPSTPASPAPSQPTLPTSPGASNPSPPSADTTAPSITITSPAVTSLSTSATSISLRGTASDNVGVVEVSWSTASGGSGKATGQTSWTITGVPLLTGTNRITVRAKDAAGNTGWRAIVVERR